MSDTDTFLSALAAVQAEAPALPKDKTNPQWVCTECGGPKKARYSKRCRPCANKAQVGRYRTDTPSPQACWERARNLRPLTQCEYPDCDTQGMDRHHIDGNPANNELSNIAVYCRRHHMMVDGRLQAAAERAARVGRMFGGRKKKAA